MSKAGGKNITETNQPQEGSVAFNSPGYEIDLTGFPPPVITVTPGTPVGPAVASKEEKAVPAFAAVADKPIPTEKPQTATTDIPTLPAATASLMTSLERVSIAPPELVDVKPASEKKTELPAPSAAPVEVAEVPVTQSSRPAEESVFLDRGKLALPPVVTMLPAELTIPKLEETIQETNAADFVDDKASKKNLNALISSGAKRDEIEQIIAPRAKPVQDLPLEEIAHDFPPAQLLPPLDAFEESNKALPEAPLMAKNRSGKATEVDLSESNVRQLVVKRTTEPSTQFIPTTPEFEPAEAASGPGMDPELGPLSIDADRVESHNETGKFVFTGNVDLVCKKFRLRANKVVANRAAGGTGMEKVDAEGSVTLRMNNENGQSFTCSGNRAIYDPIKETIKLSGWPRIDEGARALVANSAATEFLIDTKTGKLSSEGATKTILK